MIDLRGSSGRTGNDFRGMREQSYSDLEYRNQFHFCLGACFLCSHSQAGGLILGDSGYLHRIHRTR